MHTPDVLIRTITLGGHHATQVTFRTAAGRAATSAALPRPVFWGLARYLVTAAGNGPYLLRADEWPAVDAAAVEAGLSTEHWECDE